MGPLEQATFPLEQAPCPLEQAPFPLEQAPFPLEQATFPLEQGTFPLEQATFPLEQGTFPLEQETFPQEQTPTWTTPQLFFFHNPQLSIRARRLIRSALLNYKACVTAIPPSARQIVRGGNSAHRTYAYAAANPHCALTYAVPGKNYAKHFASYGTYGPINMAIKPGTSRLLNNNHSVAAARRASLMRSCNSTPM